MAVAATLAMLVMGFSTAFAGTQTTDRTRTACFDYPAVVHCDPTTVTVTTTVTTGATVLVQGGFVEINLHNGTTVYCQFPAQTIDNNTWVNSFPKDVRGNMTSASEAWSSCAITVTHIPGTP